MPTYMRVTRGGRPVITGLITQTDYEGWIDLEEVTFSSGLDKKEEKKDKKSKGDSDDDEPTRNDKPGLTINKRSGPDTCGILDWLSEREVYDVEIDQLRDGGVLVMRLLLKGVRVQSIEYQAKAKQNVTEDIALLYKTLTLETTFQKKDSDRKERSTATTVAGDRLSRRKKPGSGKRKILSSTKSPRPGRNQPEVAAAAAPIPAPPESPFELDDFDEDDLVQEDRNLEIDKVGGIEFELDEFSGFERMSELFEFNLSVMSQNLEVDANKVVGQSVGWRIKDDPKIDKDRKSETRDFHGVVRQITALSISGNSRQYVLTVVPWTWLLSKKTDCRIFQKLSVVEIVERVFSDLGFSDFKKQLQGSYPKIEYCVQYRETDLAFVSRLLEDAGIFYFFEHTASKHTMVLADATVAHEPCTPAKVSQTSGTLNEEHITAWARRVTHISGATRFRDYNYETPAESLEAASSSVVKLPKISKFELYDYPGGYLKLTDGKRFAKIRIEEEEAQHFLVDGASLCDGFTSGSKITIDKHECEEEEGEQYTFLEVTHDAEQLPADVKSRVRYSNTFECIPADTIFRPERRTPRPMVYGPQTAVVVGVAGEEIDPSKHAAVKVKFRWDREPNEDENSSCWLRCTQTMAGKNWGGLWIPRIGQEVLVEFLEGDPDRPLVTGTLYNEDSLPPYPLPANKTQSGMKTRSSKDGKAENFNELRFEDKKGSEQVYFHAEKDFERVVENDDTLTVGKDDKGNQVITIEKDRTITVNKGNQSTTVTEGKDEVTIEKDRTVTIKTGKHTLHVKTGDRIVNVDTGNDKHTIKTGNRETNINTGNDSLTLKMGNQSTTLKMGNQSTTLDLGNQTTKAKLGKISMDAMMGIELKVGSNSIKIDQTGITIKGMMVKVEGQIQTSIKGLMTEVNGSAMLKAGGGITMIG